MWSQQLSLFQRRANNKIGGSRRRSSTTATTKTVEETAPPPYKTLRWVAFTTGLPFVGFGFMDNAILVIAGDAIDTSLGVSLGISTMCAAAIGNIISDLAGIGCAASIEEFCATTLNLPVPKLTEAQRQLRTVRMASQGGMAIGMTIGCILGMLPLLFIDSSKADRLKEKARLERLCLDVLNGAKSLVGAESTCLYLRVDKHKDNEKASRQNRLLPDYHPSVDGEYLYAMYYVEPQHDGNHTPAHPPKTLTTKDPPMRTSSTNGSGKSHSSEIGDVVGRSGRDNNLEDAEGNLVVPQSKPTTPHHHPISASRVLPVGKGIVSRAVLTGTTWNIAGNLMDEPDFYPLSIETGTEATDCTDAEHDHFRDCAVVPILDGRGRVIAVLEAFNKKRTHDKSNNVDIGGFTDEDVEILMSLASHVSVSLQKIYQEGEEEHDDFGLENTIRILQESKSVQRSKTRRSLTTTTSTTDCDQNDTTNGSNEDKKDAVNAASSPSNTARRNMIKLFPDK